MAAPIVRGATAAAPPPFAQAQQCMRPCEIVLAQEDCGGKQGFLAREDEEALSQRSK
jgi:hypothetical protein